jgi:cytoskeletal protein CcmA (bactofilin family)
MWKRQEEKPSNPFASSMPAPVREEAPFPSTQFPEKTTDFGQETAKPSAANIGKSLQVKGELRGSEDLYIDGQVEGSIELRDYSLTVGPSGKVHANINAKKVIIHGSVKGNIRAVDSVDVRKSGSLMGDLVVAGVIIAEGAYFKGSIDIQKAGEAEKKASEPKASAPPAPSLPPSRFAGVASGAK